MNGKYHAHSEAAFAVPLSISALAIYIAAAALFFFLSANPTRAQERGGQKPADPHSLVSEVVNNELNSQKNDQSLWSYSETHKAKRKARGFHVVETKDGEVDQLVSLNGQPLSQMQRKKENDRIERLLANPEDIRKQHASEASDANEERKLLKMLPDAFIYKYDGMQGANIRLRFRPNPQFNASDHESEVFHHMDGTMLVDAHQKRLAELDGRIISEVKFGGGLLGHLDKGGTFSVKQQDVGGGHWEMTYLNVQMNGKALFFKTIAVRETESDSNFHRLPDNLSAGQAAKILNVRSGT